MATQSVQLDFNGPDWPLGAIIVATPGTPVNIMSLVDATNVNAPQTATPPVPNSLTRPSNEYTQRAQQIMFQGYTPDTHGMKMNTGNVYIMRKGVQGLGNRDDYGSMVFVLAPGQTFFLASAPLNRNVFGPYRYFIDADTAADGALVTLIIQ